MDDSPLHLRGRTTISVMAFPLHDFAYTKQFYGALAALGVDIREGIFAGRWLVKNLRQVDYVHIHWPSFFYAHKAKSRSLYSFAVFLFFLLLARLRGARLIWTVHNVYPHRTCSIPALDKIARWVIVRAATRFLIHGSSAAQEVLRHFPTMAGRIDLIDRGSYIGYYPNSISRDAARARLGLGADDFVVLFFGVCAPYKNLPGLIAAMSHLPERATLVIAGRFQEPTYETEIRGLIAACNRRVTVRSEYVPDDELQVYLLASDVVAAPYLEVLISGTAMLALTFGRPFVAPKRGFLKDVITEGCGILYDPSDPRGLPDALRAAMATRFEETAIKKAALAHDWKQSAQGMLDSLMADQARHQ
jgi:beta-1,4-mannosyltransferase